jgi:tRNA threonylcarbamoyladenosine biosynthesis protein TsaB
MRIVAIDTSQPAGHVAVSTGEGFLRDVALEHPSSHLVELGRAVDRLLSEAGINAGDIDRVAVISGPGSFTGLRIGMAYAKGLYAGLGTDIVVISSLELLAIQGVQGGLPVSPMIDARKDEVYAALYVPVALGDGEDPAGPGAPPHPQVSEALSARALAPAAYLGLLEARPTVFVGSGVVRYRTLVRDSFGDNAIFAADDIHVPSTRVLCGVASVLTPLTAEETTVLEPYYVRSSGAKLKPLRKISGNE